MILRPETAADAPAISRLVTEAFATAPHADGNEAEIVERLRAADALLLSLVAEEDDSLIGHIAASAVTVGETPGWACIAPVSVVPAHQRRGIGAALMRAALQALRDRGAGGVVILGDPAYYNRFGLTADGRRRIDGVPGGYVLSLPFTTDPEGAVTFHAAFGMG